MEVGAITGYMDVAQVVLYLFWGFFFALVLYLHREAKREGYPLESDYPDHVVITGFPAPPEPKTFLMPNGDQITVPREEPPMNLNVQPMGPLVGSTLLPLGDPMLDALGPAAYPPRSDHPDLTFDGRPKIVPLRAAPTIKLSAKDPNPIGLTAVGADGVAGGKVTDVWVDISDPLLRYFEVEVKVSGSAAAAQEGAAAEEGDEGQAVPAAPAATGSKRVLVPYNFGHIDTGEGQLKVKAILGEQFAKVPSTAKPDEVTLLEEDRISAFYGGGLLFATPERAEPLV